MARMPCNPPPTRSDKGRTMNTTKLATIFLTLPLALISLACPTRTMRFEDAGEPSTGGVGGSAAGALGEAGVRGVAGIGGSVGMGGSAGAGPSPLNDGGRADASTTDASAQDSHPVASPGTILWARSASSVFLYGVAEGSTGVVVSGALSGPANLGGSLLIPSRRDRRRDCRVLLPLTGLIFSRPDSAVVHRQGLESSTDTWTSSIRPVRRSSRERQDVTRVGRPCVMR